MRTNIFKKIGQYFANLKGGKNKSKTDLYETPEQLLSDIKQLPHFSSVEANKDDKLKFYVDLLSIISRGSFIKFIDPSTKKYSEAVINKFKDELRPALRDKGLEKTEYSGVPCSKTICLTEHAKLECTDTTGNVRFVAVNQFTYPKELVNNLFDARMFGYTWDIATGDWTDTWLQANAPEIGKEIQSKKVEAKKQLMAEWNK